MEFIKPHHKKSQSVTRGNLNQAWKQGNDIVEFLEKGNAERFTGAWQHAYGIADAQVSEKPLKLFVVSQDLVANKKVPTLTKNKRNWSFPHAIIFNAEIIEACDKLERMVPKKEVVRGEKLGQFSVEMRKVPQMVTNIIEVPDACMSYPWRTAKTTKRYHTIKVRYQIVCQFLGFKWLKTVTEEVEGLKAHIFQHEVDHAYGIDIYFGNDRHKDPVKPYKNVGATQN